MKAAARLVRELGQLRRVLTPVDFGRYCLALAVHAPRIAAKRSLVPADLAMHGTVPFYVEGGEIHLPLDDMARLLAGHDATPSFGAAREMYAANVYLSAFGPSLTARTTVDLGSNRGLFLLLAHRALKSKLLIGVEPTAAYTPVFRLLAETNGIPPAACMRYEKCAGSASGAATVTLAEIMDTHGIERIGFMKCDIEGGEFDVFVNDGSFLDRVDNIAMELHPFAGDVALIAKKLERAGFAYVVTDQFMNRVPPREGHYLYASSTGDLAVAA